MGSVNAANTAVYGLTVSSAVNGLIGIRPGCGLGVKRSVTEVWRKEVSG